MTPSSGSSAQRRLGLWLARACALALGLLLAEAICRIAMPPPFEEHLVATGILLSPRWGIVHEPGARYRHRDEADGTDFEIRINSQGYRNDEIGPRRPGRQRIVFVGDSFTEGFGVDVEDGFVARSEAIFRKRHPSLDLEAINAGIRGGAPSKFARQIERTLALDPDAIVVVVFDNDLFDDYAYRVDRDLLRVDAHRALPAMLRGSRLAALSAELAARVRLAFRESRLRALTGEDPLRSTELRYGSGRVSEDPIGFYVDPDLWQPHWEHTKGHLHSIIERARARGVDVGLFYIPAPQTGLHGDCCRGIYPAYDVEGHAAYSPLQAWLEELAQEEAVPFAELVSTLLALELQGDPEPVYLIPNGHLNARGNRLAAEALQPLLESLISGGQAPVTQSSSSARW